MQQPTRANSIKSWALHPHGDFLGSRALKGIALICIGAFAYLLVSNSTTNDAAYERDTAVLQKAAQEDGFSLADRARIENGRATIALQFGRCVFDNTVVTVNNEGDITGYDISLGGVDSYHRNTAGIPRLAQITDSGDMPVLTTFDENGKVTPCTAK